MTASTPRIGAHVSIADGYDAAVDSIAEYGGTCGQIFVGSPRTWRVSTVAATDSTDFTEARAAADIGPWIVHGTYLINFATPKPDLAEKSIDTVQAELDAAAELGVEYYTFHPGSHTGAGVETGLENVGTSLAELEIPESVTVLLENTAGGGTSLGTTPSQLRAMIDAAGATGDQIGVCLDTCHLHAAGYDLTDADELDALVDDLETELGLDRVQYLHLNDSKHPRGSNKDGHEHIGHGEIGRQGFELFVNHPALRSVPKVLETPVDDDRGYAWNIAEITELYAG